MVRRIVLTCVSLFPMAIVSTITPCLARGSDLPRLTAAAANVSNADGLINYLHHTSWVRPDEDGRIQVRISTLAASQPKQLRSVTAIISRDGEVIQRIQDDASGVIWLDNLAVGAYGLQIYGENAYAATAIRVLPDEAKHLQASLEIHATNLSREQIRESLAAEWVPSDRNPGHREYYREHQREPIAEKRFFQRVAPDCPH